MTRAIQNQAKNATITLRKLSDGTRITGITDTDVAMYIRKEGGSLTQKTIDSSNFSEVDATNSPGLYEIDFTAAEMDTIGEFTVVVKENGGADLAQAELRIDVESDIASTLSDIQGGGFSTSTDSLEQIRSTVDDVETLTARVLGMSHENVRIDNHQYDANNNLTSSRIRLFPTANDAQNQTNVLAEYEMTASYDSGNRLTSYSVIKQP